MTPYNQDQASYRTEINSALADKPDSLFLVAFPADGATALREWISFGGTQNLILSNDRRLLGAFRAEFERLWQQYAANPLVP